MSFPWNSGQAPATIHRKTSLSKPSSVPWHVGSAPAPEHKRVVSGNGFNDPRVNFLSDRANEQARQESMRSNYRRNRLNARAAWEIAAEQRLEAAQKTREEAQRRLKNHKDETKRKDTLRNLYHNDFEGWLSESSRLKKEKDSPSLEKLREKVQTIQTARDTERSNLVNQARDRIAVSNADLLRPYEAQARLEEVVDSWSQDNHTKKQLQEQAKENENNFFNKWTPRYDNIVSDSQNLNNNRLSNEELKEQEIKKSIENYEIKKNKQSELNKEWNKNRIDRITHLEDEKTKEKQFLNKWIGEDKNVDNMYVWRDPAQEVKDLGDDTEVVVAELTLDLDFHHTCGDPEKAKAFQDYFINDLANKLGCDVSCIVINGLSEGSVIVNFVIQTNPSQKEGKGAKDLLSNLDHIVQSGVPIGGGPCKGLKDKTPNTEKIEQQKMKLLQRNSNLTYLDYNLELAKHRSWKKKTEENEEKEKARLDAERDQWALEEQKRKDMEKHAAEKEAYLRMEEERRLDQLRADEMKALKDNEGASLMGQESLLWRRADAEVAARRKATAILAQEVEEGRKQQYALRQAKEEENRRKLKEESELLKQQNEELKMLELKADRAKKDKVENERLRLWHQMKSEEIRRKEEVTKENEMEKAINEANKDQEERFKPYLPKTRLQPPEFRNKGLRQQPIFDQPQPQLTQGQGYMDQNDGTYHINQSMPAAGQRTQLAPPPNQRATDRGGGNGLVKQSQQTMSNLLSHEESQPIGASHQATHGKKMNPTGNQSLGVAWGGQASWAASPQQGWMDQQPTPQQQQQGWMDQQPTPQQQQQGWMDQQPTPQQQQQGWMDQQPTPQQQQQGWMDQQPTPQQQQQQQQQQGWMDQEPTTQSKSQVHFNDDPPQVNSSTNIINDETKLSQQWNDKVDGYIHKTLSVRIAMLLIALKSAFIASKSIDEAKAIERFENTYATHTIPRYYICPCR